MNSTALNERVPDQSAEIVRSVLSATLIEAGAI
jgi:hypothetical protein